MKGIDALSAQTPFNLILAGGTAASVEAFKGLFKTISQMIADEVADAAYTNVPVAAADPLHEAVFDITVANSRRDFTVVLVSDSNPNAGAKGRAGISSRRPIDLVKATDLTNLATPKAYMALLNYIEKVEDQVAQTGVGTTGDMTSETRVAKSNTPWVTHEFTLTKADAVYTVVATADSN